MPFQNLKTHHFIAAEKAQFTTLMNQLDGFIQPKLSNLSDEEMRKYKKLNNRQISFINKDRDYHKTQSALDSPDVDWVEFEQDYDDRTFLELAISRLRSLANAMEETKRLHDYDNYNNAKVDFEYSTYKSNTEPGVGYDTKVQELEQFFVRKRKK